jgi:hypothetical protein
MAYNSIDREPGIRQNPQFTDRSGSGNPDHRVNRPNMMHEGKESS